MGLPHQKRQRLPCRTTRRSVIEVFGGCAPAAPGSVTQSEICGQPQNRGAVTGKRTDRLLRVCLSDFIYFNQEDSILCVVL